MSVYRGRCACCGAGKKSAKLKSYPRAFPVPPDFAGKLSFQSAVNCRICKDCQTKFYKSPVKARQIGPAGSPAVRQVTPRKRAAPSPEPIALDRALANRSRSAKGLLRMLWQSFRIRTTGRQVIFWQFLCSCAARKRLMSHLDGRVFVEGHLTFERLLLRLSR